MSEAVNLHAVLAALKEERLNLERAIHSFERFVEAIDDTGSATSTVRMPVLALVRKRGRPPGSKNKRSRRTK